MDFIIFYYRFGFKVFGYDSKGYLILILNYDGLGEDWVLFLI